MTSRGHHFAAALSEKSRIILQGAIVTGMCWALDNVEVKIKWKNR